MALLSSITRLGAAGALALATLAPVAAADDRGRGDRGGHYDRGDRGHHGNRGGHHGNRDWDRGRHHNNGGWDRNRHHNKGGWDRGRDHHRDWNRGRDYHRSKSYYRPHNYSYRAPRVVNRYYYSTPSYYRPRPGISFHYNSGYYHPRYRIGGHYAYGPSTIIIRDYDRYGLYRPPHGHHWVRDSYSGDAVLASVATGAIIGLAVGLLSQ